MKSNLKYKIRSDLLQERVNRLVTLLGVFQEYNDSAVNTKVVNELTKKIVEKDEYLNSVIQTGIYQANLKLYVQIRMYNR
jgi:hypothetical protein